MGNTQGSRYSLVDTNTERKYTHEADAHGGASHRSLSTWRDRRDLQKQAARLQKEHEADVFVLPENRISRDRIRDVTGINPENANTVLDYLYWRDLHSNIGRPIYPDWNTRGTTQFDPRGTRYPEIRGPKIITPKNKEAHLYGIDTESAPPYLTETALLGKERDGPQIEYDAEGNLLQYTMRHNNLKHGSHVIRIGKMWREDTYVKGHRTGTVTVRYPNQAVFFQAVPVMSDLTNNLGYQLEGFYPEGNPMFHAFSSPSGWQFTGQFLFYHRNGGIAQEITFDNNGNPIKRISGNSKRRPVKKGGTLRVYSEPSQRGKSTVDERLRSLILMLLYEGS